MAVKVFGNSKIRGSLTAAAIGLGLALTACGASTLGAGIATAAPQQPFSADDSTPAPVPAGPDPTTAVNVANAILKQLNSVLNVVLPGSGSLMPQSGPTPASAVGVPSLATQQPALLSSYPGSTLAGQSPVLAGQAPLLPGQLSPTSVPISGETVSDATAQTSLNALAAAPPEAGFAGG
ncbi:MAG: hypothetical protein K2Q25_04240 [Mycobacteriaceae bacterium]|nr:hypothetical protein [Mycobacteriaceae bacterium]